MWTNVKHGLTNFNILKKGVTEIILLGFAPTFKIHKITAFLWIDQIFYANKC